MPARDQGAPRQALFAAGLTAALLALGLRPRSVRDNAGQAGDSTGSAYPDDGRGRHAATPSELPARGWWDILKRTVRESLDDRVLTEAAGITFYALLAIFPALTALVSVYGLFADPQTVSQHLSTIEGFVPGGGMEIISEQVSRLASQPSGSLGFGFVAGLAVALWSANQGMKALFGALNVVYEEEEKRSFLWFTAITLLFTVGAILFVLLAIAAIVVLPIVLNFVGLGGTSELLLRLSRWPLLLIGITIALALIYRYGPSRQNAKWRWVSWGGVVAAVLWVAGSIGFSWYVSNFGNYNETYGSLGAAIGFMTWIWLSSAIVLVGAELNAEMEHQTARDTTTGTEKPLGARGARMADRVAPAGD
jgi:membrane protein